MNVDEHNKNSWDLNAKLNVVYSTPFNTEVFQKAQRGEFKLRLSPHKSIPSDWLPELKNKNILLLAGAGGQQGPLLACLGAHVTVFDISAEQLRKDEAISQDFELSLTTVQGSMSDLSLLSDNGFDLIINPLSNCFVENLEPVWSECHRVLSSSGELIYSFLNPNVYLYDFEKKNRGEFVVKYSLPYSDLNSLNTQEKERYFAAECPLEFGHTLESQIGTLLNKGFCLTGLYEDYDHEGVEFNQFSPSYIVGRAKKL
jgi:SAM-dependent methyltransferase